MNPLRQHIVKTGTRAKHLAERLGISRGAMADILSGRRTPGLHLALRIEAETGVPPQAWSVQDREASE
jgi:transcriptional regulator with XRE-family HTH domain